MRQATLYGTLGRYRTPQYATDSTLLYATNFGIGAKRVRRSVRACNSDGYGDDRDRERHDERHSGDESGNGPMAARMRSIAQDRMRKSDSGNERHGSGRWPDH